MTTFVQPYFWSRPRWGSRERWSAMLVTPAVAIASSSVATASVITTSVPHGLASGDTTTIAGHAGSTPSIDGSRVVTVLTSTTFTIPVTVTVAGSGGTVTQTTAAPVVSLADAKLQLRFSSDVTTEDVPVANWTSAATAQVEQDTGVKLRPETYDITGDVFPPYGSPFTLPFGPLASVVYIKTIDSAAAIQTLAASEYIVDTTRIPGRIGLSDAASWPTDLRLFQPISMRVVVGYSTLAAIPAPLLQAVRVLIGWHAMNREPNYLTWEKASPAYDYLVDPYRAVTVA